MVKKLCIVLCVLLYFNFQSSAQLITTVAGNGISGSPLGDGGPATAANLGIFAGLAFDDVGNLYLTDENKNRLRKIDANTGIITTVAGDGTAGYSGDNGPATGAVFNELTWVAIDRHNNIYVTDGYNERIRKINAVTGIITTVAGNGTVGFNGDNILATAAQLNTPHGIAVDFVGNLYIVDNANFRIRRVDTFGIITTIAGNGNSGYGQDGIQATQTEVAGIYGLCLDNEGNVYFSEQDNNRVRKVNIGTGIITTVAGTGNAGFSGNGGPAVSGELHWPFGIKIDAIGNLYIADRVNNRIRKVDTAGIIHSIAGSGITGFSGDGGLADTAKLNRPEGVTVDLCGNVYFTDAQNNRIRKVTFHPNCFPESVKNVNKENEVNIYPNPAEEQLTIACGSGIKELRVMNTIGQVLIEQKNYTEKAIVNVSGLNSGVYFIQMSDKDGRVVTRRFVKE